VVAELDELGFPALWIPEALGKEVMSHHVALQVLTADPAILPLREWRELAALLD
jgi:hypothetical protein